MWDIFRYAVEHEYLFFFQCLFYKFIILWSYSGVENWYLKPKWWLSINFFLLLSVLFLIMLKLFMKLLYYHSILLTRLPGFEVIIISIMSIFHILNIYCYLNEAFVICLIFIMVFYDNFLLIFINIRSLLDVFFRKFCSQCFSTVFGKTESYILITYFSLPLAFSLQLGIITFTFLVLVFYE